MTHPQHFGFLNCQLVGTLQPAGASAGMLTGAVPAGASKNVAVKTASVSPVLTAVCTWPCPGSTNAVPAGYRRAGAALGRDVGQLTLGDGDEHRSRMGVPGNLCTGLYGDPGGHDVGQVCNLDHVGSVAIHLEANLHRRLVGEGRSRREDLDRDRGRCRVGLRSAAVQHDTYCCHHSTLARHFLVV